jgi:hypothetical protein
MSTNEALFLAAAQPVSSANHPMAADFDRVSKALGVYLFEKFPDLEFTFVMTDEMKAAKAAFLEGFGWTVEVFDRAMLLREIEFLKSQREEC